MKGTTNNPNGRPKGVPNKMTADLKSRIAQIVENGLESMQSDLLEALEPKERVGAYLKMLEYLLPKYRETKIDVSQLSDGEVEELLSRALNKMNHENS